MENLPHAPAPVAAAAVTSTPPPPAPYDSTFWQRVVVIVSAMIAPLLAVVVTWTALSAVYVDRGYPVVLERFCPPSQVAPALPEQRCYHGLADDRTGRKDGEVRRWQLYDPQSLPLAEYRARMTYFATSFFLAIILVFALLYALRLTRELDRNLYRLCLSCVVVAGAFMFLLSALDHPWTRNLYARELMRPVLKLLPAPFFSLPEGPSGLVATAWRHIQDTGLILHTLTALGFTACGVMAASCWLAAPKPADTERYSAAEVSDLVPAVARSVSRLRLALYLMALMMGFSIVYMHAMFNWPLSLFDAKETAVSAQAKALVDTLVLYWSLAFTAAIAIVYVPIAYVTSRRVDAIIEKETKPLSHADALAWPAKNGLVFSIATEAKALIAMFAPLIAGIASSTVKGLIGA